MRFRDKFTYMYIHTSRTIAVYIKVFLTYAFRKLYFQEYDKRHYVLITNNKEKTQLFYVRELCQRK